MHIDAKLQFKLRTLQNVACCIAGFVAWAAFCSFLPFRWLLDLVGIAVAWYVLFFVLEKRPIGFRCPGCLKYISSNTPWVCGVCKRENRRPDDFPFVHHCEHCSAQPKAYKCHHTKADKSECDRIIFLSEDEQEQNYAYCLNTETQLPPEDKRMQRNESKEALVHDIEMAELASKLDSIKQRAEFSKKKSPTEEIEESFEKHHSRFMGTREFARRQRAVNAGKFKDDPEMLKFADEAVDDWERSRL